MPGLRIFKNRGDQSSKTQDHDGDDSLRGLADPSLFQDSRLSIQLLIHRPPARDQIMSIAQAYNLVSPEAFMEGETIHLQSLWQAAGEHKKQALVLFIVAMEISRSSPSSRCLIYQVNHARKLLERRMEGHRSTDPNASEIEKWKSEQARFSIDAPVAHYLKQSGFAVNGAQGFTEISQDALKTFHAELTKDASKSQLLRKVG